MTATALLLGVMTGLALASIYVLITMSFTLVLAVSGVFNFAQGSVVMGGSILAFILGVQFGWPILITIAATSIAGLLAGFASYWISVWPAFGRSHSFTHTTLMTTIGLGLAVNALAALLFGSDSYRVPSYVTDNPIVVSGLPIRPIYLLMIVVGIVTTFAVDLVIRRTAMGHVFRITLEDPEGARLQGVNIRRTIVLTFGVAGAMSALAGLLIAPVTSASAFSAHELSFFGFAGMAIGGFGSFLGGLAGALIVGLVAGITPIVADPNLTLPLLWLIVVVTLLVKPSGIGGIVGLFGAARVRDV
jgi:branched-chain amino acid transport system permease protein